MADKDIATEMHDPEVPHEEEESVHDEPLEENPAQEVEVNTETDVTEDKRKRKFTEKGQELHNEKLKKFQRNFDKTYEKWKVLAKEAKKALSLPNSTKVLHEHQIQIHTADLEVKERYEDVRKYSVPDADTRRRVDTCDAVSKQLIERLHVLQDEDTDKHLPTVRAPWGNTGSVFSCQEDQVSMLSPPFSGRVSKRSSVSSTKKQEAEAELAATKATLKVLAEMEQEEKELERLEAENRRQLAQQEAENAERHKLLEEKRRQLKRLEATKRMNAAKARLQVYEQDVGSDEEISDLLHNHNLPPLKANALPRYSMPSQSASKLPTTTYEVPKPTSQVARPTFHDNSTTMLAEAIAESINTSRLPVPEPPIFSGDPIRYKDWKMSFLTLIGRKNIPVNEKIYYLRKYVTGAAKKAIESYFLVGTEEAYYSTWEILEEQYGNSFVVAKAFHDKLNSWTKIGPKDSVELREFADFLRGCQAAMSHIKSLEVLNDCSENQRILSKLPDWLTARWNRKVMEFEEEPQDFPSFHTFVEFVSREAKIACNPMTSLHALKSGDAERAKPSKVRNVGAKVLASASEEKPDVEGQRGNAKGCMFCEKTNHGIQTCRKLIEKPIKERVKYVQTKNLCFACLRPGHHSKSCEKRSVCNVCTGRHPTCLHEDRAKADEKIQADGQNESGKPSKGKEKPKEQKHGDTESTTTEVASTAMSNQVMHNRNSTYASTIVPVWLSTTRNPDAEVLDSTRPDQWRHVSSEDNPADHASRGLRAQELIASNWFSGPDFLWCEELPSGNVEVEDVAVEDPEVRNVFVHKASATEVLLLDRFLKFSCWTRLVKAIARLMRLTEELKGSIPRTNEATSLVERSDAEATIISLVQREAFAEEIQTLQHRKELVKTSKLHKLNPFLDEQGILRVGGRLTHADLHHHIKHPAVLPAKGHVTRLLIQHYHQQVQHQGRGITVNELRANGFWILGCSHAVSSCINKCVKCRRFRRSTENQLMADLPRDRMEETPPFTYSGIDCFGPFYVKDGRKESKRYGLLFTCLCSRAVHIELLEEMTTDFFTIALRAFIAIRGNVRQLRCDQGTNFVGARREFIEALKEMDQERLKILGCEFFMNPPSASHMGGAWERQIRIIRSVLTSILDQSSNRLDTSSLRTYFYEVMAVINSRPLTAHLLNDPMGPQPLSPNHILTMKSSIILPPPGKFEREDLYLRKRWRKVQHLANEFWSRWRKEYLLNLQPRQKWQRKRRNAKVNDIVIVQDDTAPRTEWKLAKVTKVYPAEDGCVRKLQLLISDSTLDKEGKHIGKPVYLERPIHKTVTLIEAE
ncbi:hypothetical protein SRHO_G00059040 [Serrasalmus rhombeus]